MSDAFFAGKLFPDVPSHIASAASEAHKAFEARCHRAAVILARAVIEATAKDKGIAANGIAAKIREMEEQRLIRPHVREGADEVRHFGNEMAHGDFIGEVGANEVALALELMDDVLNEAYQSPARVEKARARRNRTADPTGQTDTTTVPPLGAITAHSRRP
jgi:hypothetical protein